MRSIKAFLLSLSLAFSALAVSGADPSGTWKIEITTPDGQTYRPEATMTKSEDGLIGSYYSTSADQTFDLQDVKFDSDNTLHFTLDTQGLTVAYSGKIKGDKMSGLARINYQDQQYDADFSATR